MASSNKKEKNRLSIIGCNDVKIQESGHQCKQKQKTNEQDLDLSVTTDKTRMTRDVSMLRQVVLIRIRYFKCCLSGFHLNLGIMIKAVIDIDHT